MEGLNKIIARIEKILESDPWKQRDMLRIFLDELVEKRDAAMKAKEAQIPNIGAEIGNIPKNPEILGQEDLIAQGKEVVAEFFPETI